LNLPTLSTGFFLRTDLKVGKLKLSLFICSYFAWQFNHLLHPMVC
jgi:hypothetical protein